VQRGKADIFLQHSSLMNIVLLIDFLICISVSCGHSLWVVYRTLQWLLNKLETHDLKECESTLKYEIWWWNWGKMIKVICTWVCVGPAHIRKTVDKNVPKSTGMSRVSSCESVCVRVCLITSSIPILDPTVSHLFYAICHIYYSHISDMQYFFIYYIYIYIY